MNASMRNSFMSDLSGAFGRLSRMNPPKIVDATMNRAIAMSVGDAPSSMATWTTTNELPQMRIVRARTMYSFVEGVMRRQPSFLSDRSE